jgi:flagella basal body P-ring formation protein FlgA
MIVTAPRRSAAIILALAGLLITAGLAGTAAADGVVARDRVTVERNSITLGDLFDGVPAAKASRKVLRAPAPGQERRVSGVLLDRIARDHGLAYDPADSNLDTTVRRASHRVPRESVKAAVRRALAERGIGDELRIVLNNRDLDLELATTSPATVRLEDFSYRRRSQRFSARVYAPANGEPQVRASVTGQAVRMVQVPVLAGRVGRGETIQEDDVTWVERASDDIRGNHITDADKLVGFNARRPLHPGELIRTSAVEEPILVEDGSLVTIRLKTGQMSLTAKGEALEDGAMSDTIRVENIQSEQIVTGTVSGPGAVAVDPTRLPTN